jgi:hypothetical protein
MPHGRVVMVNHLLDPMARYIQISARLLRYMPELNRVPDAKTTNRVHTTAVYDGNIKKVISTAGIVQ